MYQFFFTIHCVHSARLAQSVEHETRNLGVDGLFVVYLFLYAYSLLEYISTYMYIDWFETQVGRPFWPSELISVSIRRVWTVHIWIFNLPNKYDCLSKMIGTLNLCSKPLLCIHPYIFKYITINKDITTSSATVVKSTRLQSGGRGSEPHVGLLLLLDLRSSLKGMIHHSFLLWSGIQIK